LFLAFTNIIGAVGLYNLEHSRRKSFLEAKQLKHLARIDPLTGIANRKAFDERLAAAWAYCRREHESVAVALVDIDCFKAFNDSYGHQSGDRCLIKVARTLQQAARRPLDLTARFGGEEFVILLPGSSPDHAEQLIEDLRQQVEMLNIPNAKSTVSQWVTFSAGIAYVIPSRTNRSSQGLLQMADEALYEAKENGRNRLVVSRDEEIESAKTGVFRIGVDFDPAKIHESSQC
jgi:diguanylate cyclase (GGDEF)-like protein